ncbi:MAG: LysM peptidoglycan-binding domain-containing protein [Chitinispirillaceae bacterium]|nr:LysM peptidoglycan-binding domain-containing protein [Chitinispirillaceae bacterium]
MTSRTIISLLTVFSLFPFSAAAQGWDEGSDASFSEPAIEPAAPPPSPAADQDATYVIKPGDTLWDLAFQFLGDPFQWQRIWEVNSYITNPDLIYPGNRLQIPGRYTGASSGGTSGNDQGFSSETAGALNETSSLKDELTASSGYPGDSSLLGSLRLKDVLSKGYLAKVPFLWTEKDRSGNIFPGNAVVNPPSIGKSYQRFTTLSFKLISSAVYRVNDTVDIYTSLRFVRFNNQPANLVRRVGRACVSKTEGREVHALLFDMADAIVGKERVAPATVFSSCTIDTLIDPSVSISAKVFTRVEQTESPYPYQMIILDKGSTQGVELGDVFGIYHRDNKKSPAKLSVIGSIGHVGAASSTLNMFIMVQNRVSEGDQAVLLRRAQCSP